MDLLSKLLKDIRSRPKRVPTWLPAYPEAAYRNVPLGDTKDLSPDDDPGRPWTQAPASSHLKRFRFIDSTKDRVQKLTGKSELQVEFDNNTAYGYFFAPTHAGAAEGRSIFEAMRDAESPGAVLNARLVKPRVPYTRLA